MPVRIGDLLVESGRLTAAMRDEILDEQRVVARPFGELAERMFGIDPDVIEQAWAEQYESLAGVIDPARYEPDADAAAVVTPRQAWQFRLLPLRFEHGEVMIATPRANLPRALRFAATQIAEPCFFVVAEPEAMAPVLQELYPMPGLDASTLVEPAPRLTRRGA
ncbi:MAG: hypothetical protein AAFR96_10320 [Planctomycetota bacterium]